MDTFLCLGFVSTLTVVKRDTEASSAPVFRESLTGDSSDLQA
jgi:hypothetical protein